MQDVIVRRQRVAMPRCHWGAALVLLLSSTFGASGVADAAGSCTPAAPSVMSDNNWAWGGFGSWGLPGQQLLYGIKVTNNDVGCGSSTFVVSVSVPSGFAVSIPTNSISLKAPEVGYLSAYITAPATIADGDYPIGVSVQRATSPGDGAASTTYFKVYSSDTTAPTLYWTNPANGMTISGRSYNVTVDSRDDHAVQRIELYIDNTRMSTTTCDDVTYSCTLSYNWSLRRAKGQHTATYKSYDWLGNTGVLTVNFTVS